MRMKPYHEMIRWSQPFLLIYAQGDNTIDANKVKEKVEIVKRKRRQLGRISMQINLGNDFMI